MNITVFGLGKLGSPLAAVWAAEGHHVIGYDVDEHMVEQLDKGIAPVDEPGLQDLIDALWDDHLRATTVAADAVRVADVIFIIVPTPSNNLGTFSCRYVCDAARTIAAAMPEDPKYRVIVLVSTVMPGDTEGELIPIIESMTDMKCGPDFGVCYNPEFIALGSVIQGMQTPDYVLIGESDVRAGNFLESLYLWPGSLCPQGTPVKRMTIREAEVVKLAQNVFVTMKMSFANVLGELCENLFIDAHVVVDAIGTDHRIGKAYLHPGPAYGGPCFPRDNRAFAKLLLLHNHHVSACLPEAIDLVNQHQTSRLADRVMEFSPKSVGILGLAYKTDTAVSEESAGVLLRDELLRRGVMVVTHDPKARSASGLVNGPQAEKVVDVLREVSVVVITTPWSEYRKLPTLEGHENVTVIDCWGMFSEEEASQFGGYVRLGKGIS